MREIVPLVCSNCGAPADPSLNQPCAYCGVPAPHDPEVRARLRRHAEHSRRLGAKLRSAALHQLHAAAARRQRRVDGAANAFHGLLTVLIAAVAIVGAVMVPAAVQRKYDDVAAGIALFIYLMAGMVALGYAAELAPRKRARTRTLVDLARCEEKLELAREVRCGNCGARSSYVQVEIGQSLSCPYCRAVLHAECDAFEQRVRQAVRRALIEAHAEAALDDADAGWENDPTVALMELAGFRHLGGIYERPDAPCWVHSHHEQPWRCVVSAETTLPGRLILMTPDTEKALGTAQWREVKLPETRFTVRLGGRELLGFADGEVAAQGVHAYDALDDLATRLDAGELVQLDGAGATAFRLHSEAELDTFARDFAGPLLAVVRALAPPAA